MLTMFDLMLVAARKWTGIVWIPFSAISHIERPRLPITLTSGQQWTVNQEKKGASIMVFDPHHGYQGHMVGLADSSINGGFAVRIRYQYWNGAIEDVTAEFYSGFLVCPD